MAWLATVLSLVLGVPLAGAQSGPVGGLYQIVSGSYSACCGIAGEMRSSLPNQDQGFVRLVIDPASNLATMTFLGQGLRPVFSVALCPPADPISFSFGYGLVLSNSIQFHIDPGPPPVQMYWNYVTSNSPGALRLDGVVGTASGFCADVPNRFSHSNVVAVLVSQPKLSVTEFSSQGPLIFIQGEAGRTNVLEASSDLSSWMPISTNVMPDTDCPICPFISFRDTSATNLMQRFYRAFEVR